MKLSAPRFSEPSEVILGRFWGQREGHGISTTRGTDEQAMYTPGQDVRTALENRSGQMNNSTIQRMLTVQPPAQHSGEPKRNSDIPFHLKMDFTFFVRAVYRGGNLDVVTPLCSVLIETKAHDIWDALHL